MKMPFDDFSGDVLIPGGQLHYENGYLIKPKQKKQIPQSSPQLVFNGKSKRLKYGNKKTTIDGKVFDSKKEANRFQELKMLERSGLISELRTQVKFSICPKSGGNKRERFYIADFVYNEGGKSVIEDVKSPITRQNPVYSLKKALVQWQYPDYIFRES